MSFANNWLRYLEGQKGKWIRYLILRGDRPEDMPHTGISIDEGGRVKQTYYAYEEGMKIPDKIGIRPVDAKSVEVETSDGIVFYISKSETEGGKPTIKMKHIDSQGKDLSFENEKTFVREARNRGYEIVEFEQTDV